LSLLAKKARGERDDHARHQEAGSSMPPITVFALQTEVVVLEQSWKHCFRHCFRRSRQFRALVTPSSLNAIFSNAAPFRDFLLLTIHPLANRAAPQRRRKKCRSPPKLASVDKMFSNSK